MAWAARPAMAAGAPVLAEDFDAQNDQIELLSSEECSLTSDHAGVNNSTTLTSTNLSRPVVASARYVARGILFYTAGLSEDFKPGMSVPSGTTVHRATLLSGPASASPSNPTADSVYFGSDPTIGNLTAPGMTVSSNVVVAYYTVVFTTSVTAGNAILQYAQGTAGAGTSTTLKANSTWWVRRVDAV